MAISGRISELRWLGRLNGIPNLFDGEHRFEIDEIGPDRVRVTQSETFSGTLVALIGAGVVESTERSFEALNDALKSRVEALVADSLPETPEGAS